MNRANVRSADVSIRKWGCICEWIISFYLNGCFICNARRRSRAEARQVADRYIATGMIPLN